MSGVRHRAVAAVLVGVVGLAAACGVEVPEDVAADLRDTTTTTAAPTTTETPTSDDALEQALIDNGYSQAEAECGAENLRAALDESEIASIVEADTIEDISASTARAFARALRPCVEGGRPGFDGPDGGDDEDEGERPDPGGAERDVTRAQFLSSLISGGIPERQARCIVRAAFEQLDQEDINTLFHAGSDAEVPDDLLDAFQDITQSCR